MLKIIFKRKNGKIAIAFVLNTRPISKKAEELAEFFTAEARNFSKKLDCYCLKLRLASQILRANPDTLSLEKNGRENRFSFAWQDKNREKTTGFDWAPLKRKIVKSAATITALVLLLQFLIPLIPFTKADDLCPIDADAVLVIDISASMGQGASPSKCEWSELKEVPGEGYYTWFLNTKYNVDSPWCTEVRNEFDESYPSYQFIATTYSPARNSKITDAKTAANSFINNLKQGDYSALISFNSSPNTAKSLSADHLASQNAVNNLTTGGYTNIGDALLAAKTELDNSGRSALEASKTIILFSDGRANKPNDGYGSDSKQNSQDIALAEEIARQIAEAGYKIYSLGFGSDVNTTSLQNIASTGQGAYYFEPSEENLSQLYSQIAWEVCRYGSIAGCKYQDSDVDGEISEESSLPGWEIVLSGDVSMTQLTDENGCYTFSGLLAGNYTVSEGENSGKQPFLLTYPAEGLYNISLAKGENRENVDFGNAPSALCELIDTPGECVDDGAREHSFSYNFEYCGESYAANVADENCGCLAEETNRLCAGDGYADVSYSWNFDYCGQGFMETEQAPDCACQANGIPGQCAADGQREHSFSYNFDYCGGDYTENLQDPACRCLPSELSRQCSADKIAEVLYGYNFAFCGENYTQTKEDKACSSEYQCSEWQKTNCVANAISGENRICLDQYENSIEETRQIADTACGCLTQETGRVCKSDGYAQVSYTWNFDYCGQEFSQNAADEACVCQPSEISRQCSGNGQTEISYGYNFDYCGENYTESEQDNFCVSEYQCSEWQDAACQSNGIMTQTRTCTDQYQNSYEETQEATNEACNCSQAETSRICLSDGYADVSYSWNFAFCGGDYTETEENLSCDSEEQCTEWQNIGCYSDGLMEQNRICADQYENSIEETRQIAAPDCACQAIETAGECASKTKRVFSFSYNFDYCPARPLETREDLNCNDEFEQEPEDYTPECGNGILDEAEQCDDANLNENDGCSSVCRIEKEKEQEAAEEQEQGQNSSGVGSGGAPNFHSPLEIKQEQAQREQTQGEEMQVTISWLTNEPATSQVIYSREDEPHELNLGDSAGSPPKYGYAYTTPEYDTNPKVTEHSVTLTELLPETVYYFRCISRSSPPVIGPEYTFTTFAAAEQEQETSEQSAQTEEKQETEQEKMSLRQIEEELKEIANGVAEIREEIQATRQENQPSAAPQENEPAQTLGQEEEKAEEKKESLTEQEEKASFLPGEAESQAEQELSKEQAKGFLAAVVSFFSKDNALFLILFAIIVVLGLILVFRRPRRQRTQ